MARFNHNITVPRHDFIPLSDGTVARVFDDMSGVEIIPLNATNGYESATLNPDDAIRLAGFLARFHRESNAALAKGDD